MKNKPMMWGLVILTMAMLFGCRAYSDRSVDLSKINADLTLEQAFALLGREHGDDRSSMYPIEYNWTLNERQKLYIVFEDPTDSEFVKKFKSGIIVFKQEANGTGRYEMLGAAEDEIKAMEEWYYSLKAVRAYLVENGEKTILFDSKQSE